MYVQGSQLEPILIIIFVLKMRVVSYKLGEILFDKIQGKICKLSNLHEKISIKNTQQISIVYGQKMKNDLCNIDFAK